MTQRLNFYTAAPRALEPLMALGPILAESTLEPALMELVKIRASQINECGNCLHMHTADARAHGEREERIYLLEAWRESKMYTPRERAALGWTESLTRIHETHAPDADYEAVASEFSEAEIVYLTVLITAINSWNRIAIGLRVEHPNDARLKAAA
ncbi:carboxymuconolactone decarboxylase family protein [Phenylobacterium sp.]|jgi:AhpD family alkylhydroperoxidase|uniref:carboxymuconolactone decarboxylase family protein n=1 Tax=Phenylobacterium sp. TaxID=1871053 RepID=UPI002F40F660